MSQKHYVVLTIWRILGRTPENLLDSYLWREKITFEIEELVEGREKGNDNESEIGKGAIEKNEHINEMREDGLFGNGDRRINDMKIIV